MTITISKSVPEEIQIEVPGYFFQQLGSSIKRYWKVTSEESCLRFTLYEDGSFHSANYDSESDVRNAVSEGTPISEEEFSIAATECYTRFFMASQTGKDETEVVGAFEHILT